jgi:GntR family transcriptional regulator, transcriptional repressor for pyruvate dehydrogenase complex
MAEHAEDREPRVEVARAADATHVADTGWLRPAPARMRALKRSEIVAREIVEEILARDLHPGDVLPSETVMMARYSVARATLREALRLLEAQGLVTIKPGPGGGPVTTAVDASNLGRSSTLYFRLAGATYRQLAEAMEIVEPWLAQLAATQSDPEVARARLTAALEATDAVRGDAEGVWRVAPQFHETVFALSGNLVLSTTASALSAIFKEQVLVHVDLAPRQPQFLEAHRALAKAIIGRQPELAYGLALAHQQELTQYCAERVPAVMDRTVEWQ